MSTTPTIATRHWLETIVVGLNLCPFAKRELVSDRVRIEVLHPSEGADDLQLRLQALADECELLDKDPDVGTTLLVFPGALEDFHDYLDFLALAEDLLHSLGYEGVYQLASFHPAYQFADSAEDDPANYTNRSPYPMLHLLREAQLTEVLKDYPSPEKIPERNQEVCRELGIPALVALLKAPS
jgi:hypothetical protein